MISLRYAHDSDTLTPTLSRTAGEGAGVALAWLPLPRGEGWGEGDCALRHGSRQVIFGMQRA